MGCHQQWWLSLEATPLQILCTGVTKALDYVNSREGFEVVSEPFLEDGIPHVKMEKIY